MVKIAAIGKALIKVGDKLGLYPSCCCDNGGCTNPYASNYDPGATCDDGSCNTCCTADLCRIGDDCKGNDCNNLPQIGFNGYDSGPCCDSGCLPCLDPPRVEIEYRDCHASFDNLDSGNFIATGCDGNEIIYYDCPNCPGREIPTDPP